MKLYDLLVLISLEANIAITNWTGKKHDTMFNGNIEDLDFANIEKYKNYKVICVNAYNSKIIIDVIKSN